MRREDDRGSWTPRFSDRLTPLAISNDVHLCSKFIGFFSAV